MKSKETLLTMRQENFCRYYVDIGNASEAYRMAYTAENMKPETVWSSASVLLSNPKVSARVEELKNKLIKESQVDRGKVEQVLMDIILADPSEIYIVDEETGKIKLKMPNQMSKRTRNALKKICNKKGEITYEFNGKTDAAKVLGSWNGWDSPKLVDITNNGDRLGELRIGFDEESDK